MKTYDVIVIGSGLAGMSSAAALAAAGRRVLVLEQYSVLGGSTHVFRRKGKWEWQVGVHHLGDCGPDGDMPTVFRGLGLEPHITYEPMDHTGYERILAPGLTFDIPCDWDEFEARAVRSFPDKPIRIRRFFAAMRALGGGVDRVSSTASTRGMVGVVARSGVYAGLAMLPASRVMDLFGLSREFQTVLGISPSGSMDVPLGRLPFAAYATFWDRFVGGGAWFPHGGGQVFASQLRRVIEHFDGTLVTGAAVEEILVEGGAVRGVRVRDGECLRADIVISTVDIKKTYLSLLPVDACPAADLQRVDRYRMSAPFFNAYLGADVDLRGRYPNRDHLTLPTWTSLGDIDGAMRYRSGDTPERWMERVAPILPAYIHCANLKDPTSTRYAPEGSSSVEVMIPIGFDHRLWGTTPTGWRDHGYRKSASYASMKEALTDLMIERAQSVIPELKGTISHQEAGTPITQERFTQSTAGASYGIEWNIRQFGPARPGPRTRIGGLYLAGASCRQGPATEGVLLSGVVAASEVLGRNLMKEFRAGQQLVPSSALPAVPADWDPLTAGRVRKTERADRPAPVASA